MCGLYVSFGYRVTPRTFGCVAMGSTVLFILRSRFLLYSAGSGVNGVLVVLSGFSVRFFCIVQTKTLCRYGYMYFLAAIVLVSVDMNLMSICLFLHYYTTEQFTRGLVMSGTSHGRTSVLKQHKIRTHRSLHIC